MGLFSGIDNPAFAGTQAGQKYYNKHKQSKEYNILKGQFLWDPTLAETEQQTMDFAQQDFRGLGVGLAQRGADTQAQQLQNALMARGGGALQPALTMGAQNRVGAGLQGLQLGTQLEATGLTALNQLLQTKWGVLSALYGRQAAFAGTQAQAGATKDAASKAMMASLVDSAIPG